MKGKTIIYCGIFIFLTSLLLTIYNLSRSGILQIFFPNEISAGIGNLGGSLISLMFFILPILGLMIGFFLTLFGIVKALKKDLLP